MTEPTDRPAKPLPRVTPDNKPFWDACRRHELRLPWCEACDRAHWPPGPVCPYCFEDRVTWRQVPGRGRISSWVVVHKEWMPAFRDDIPYNAVQVELDEGVRLTGNVVGAENASLQVGMLVEVVFDDVSEEATLVRFQPVRVPGL